MSRAGLLVLLLPAVAAGGEIASYSASPSTYDRFLAGWPPTGSTAATPNTSPGFLGAGLDLTGIGFGPATNNGATRQAVSLIAPQYIMAAWHNRVQAGDTISFADATGALKTATVDTVTRLRAGNQVTGTPTDIMIARLTAPAPAGITPLAVASAAPVGTALLGYGSNTTYGNNNTPHLGRGSISAVAQYTNFQEPGEATWTLQTDYAPGTPGSFIAVGGDSGAPALAVANGQAVVVGGWYAASAPSDPDPGSLASYAPAYVNELREVTNNTIFFTPVPEPTGLLAVAAVGWLAARRRLCGAERGPTRWSAAVPDVGARSALGSAEPPPRG